MSEYQWKDVSVIGFDELMNALDRADRKGYMPDALKEEWEAFNWKPAQPQQEPVAEARYDGTLHWLEPHGVGLHRIQGPLYTTPPQHKPLTHEQRLDVLAKFEKHKMKWDDSAILIDLVEAAHGITGETK